MIRAVNIQDAVTVFVDSEPTDLLTYRLIKSVKQTCKHPNRINHSQGVAPNGEWYWVYSCESCNHEWTCWDEPATEDLP